MDYQQLPPNTIITPQVFIKEMNKVLQTLPEFRDGMLVRCDNAGYWLEANGIRDISNGGLLSICHGLVLNSRKPT